MNAEVSAVKEYEARPSGSPTRVVRADPDLVADVSVPCSPVPSDLSYHERRYEEDIHAWETVLTDIPSDDEDGEVFDRVVATLLLGMNMAQYLYLFKEADIGFNMFLTLTEDDLDAVGIRDKNHRKAIAHGISLIRKKKKGNKFVRGLQDDVADSVLSVEETIPVMCHTLKHINNLVILLRNYRSRFQSKSLRNQVMDQNHSAALGAKILTKEALVQAELLKVQLHGMLLTLDPLRPEKRKKKVISAPEPKKNCSLALSVIGTLLGTSFLFFALRRKHNV